MKKIYFGILLISCVIAKAQPSFAWGKQTGSSAASDIAESIIADASGNAYFLGTFSGTVDLDPGPGTFTVASQSGSTDFFITKLDVGGNFVWSKSIGGVSNDRGRKLCIDGNHIYITGYYAGTVDFDPGPGTATMTSVAADDIFVMKIDLNGNYVWAKGLGGSGLDQGFSITVDAAGNAIIVGQFYNSVDFDPGPGTSSLTAIGVNGDPFILKLTSAGNFVWAKSMGSPNGEYFATVACDPAGNIFSGGYFNHFAFDVDPGPGTNTIASNGFNDGWVLKVDASGNYVQHFQIGGTQYDAVLDLKLDASSNIYISGIFQSTVDFNPGAGTYTLVETGAGDDAFVLKLNSSGSFVWADQFAGSLMDRINSLCLDPGGNIYILGEFQGMSDVDPGPGTYTLATINTSIANVYVAKLNNAGSFLWAAATTGSGVAQGWQITVADGAIYAAGIFSTSIDLDPGPSVDNHLAPGNYDAYAFKWLDCSGLPVVTASTSTTQLCIGSSATLSAGGAISYTWNPGGPGSSIVVSPSINTTYTVSGTNINGCTNNTFITQSVITCQTAMTELQIANAESVISPNPTNGILTIQTNLLNEKLQVFNAIGELVLDSTINSQQITINLQHLSGGIYFVRIGSVTKKIIKE